MKGKILVVEDDKAIRNVVTLILENEGYKVITADHGTMVHQIIEHDKPDMIFLDIWLFGEDGESIAKEIKTKSGNLPVVLMSANNEIKQIAKTVGADDILLKPFTIDSLLSIVRKYIKS